MMKKSAAIAVLVLVSAFLLTGCSTGSGETGKGDDTLVVALPSAPISLDPSKAATGLYTNYVDTTYASLLNHDGIGKIEAGLADKWAYNSDNTELSVTLRSGLKWADGAPLTAADVVASIQYFAKGSGGTAPSLAKLTFSARGDSTVLIDSPTPNPILADLFTPEYLAGAVISPAGLKDPAKLAEATFGAGPYVYDAKQSVSGDHYVYTPNKNYYAQNAIHYKSITIKVIANTNSAVQALKSGQIDFMQGNADVAPTIKNNSNLKVLTEPSIWAGLYLLDRTGTVVPALADERVRQALNYAVDRVAITKAVYGAFGTPTDQAQVPGGDGYRTKETYSYNPAKAKKLLADAGYAQGFTIPVNYGSFDPDNTKLVQAVQAQLAAIGVKLELTAATNFGGWVNDLVSKKFAATVLSPGAGGDQFLQAQSTFLPGGIMNIFGASDSAVAAEAQVIAAASPQDHDAAARKMDQIVTEHALTLPISAVNTTLLYNSKVQGLVWRKGINVPTYVTAWTSK